MLASLSASSFRKLQSRGRRGEGGTETQATHTHSLERYRQETHMHIEQQQGPIYSPLSFGFFSVQMFVDFPPW